MWHYLLRLSSKGFVGEHRSRAEEARLRTNDSQILIEEHSFPVEGSGVLTFRDTDVNKSSKTQAEEENQSLRAKLQESEAIIKEMQEK